MEFPGARILSTHLRYISTTILDLHYHNCVNKISLQIFKSIIEFTNPEKNKNRNIFKMFYVFTLSTFQYFKNIITKYLYYQLIELNAYF